MRSPSSRREKASYITGHTLDVNGGMHMACTNCLRECGKHNAEPAAPPLRSAPPPFGSSVIDCSPAHKGTRGRDR